jgi:SAM-dependent methyltransferase
MYEDLLPHSLPTEGERLDAMGRAHDPDTRAAILDLDLPASATCLDLGTGRGSIAVWLAETMPEARVVAGDLDISTFKDNNQTNLKVVELDVQTNDIGVGVYDLIHCRAVLGFLPTRYAVLDRIKLALKPGGAIVVTEMDFGRIAAGPSQFWAAFWTAYLEFARAQDWDLEFGARLPRLLDRLGFFPINARHIAPVLNLAGDTPGAAEAQTWSLTLATLAPQLIGGGFMSESMLRDALGMIREPGGWAVGPGFMLAAAHKPAGDQPG